MYGPPYIHYPGKDFCLHRKRPRHDQMHSDIPSVKNTIHDMEPKSRIADKMVPIEELNFHPRNRNAHPEEQIERLAKIILYQGWRYPVKVSKQSGLITSGHGRVMAAKLKGWKTVPVSYQDYDSADQEYADVQSDNSIASWAELDLSTIKTDVKSLGPGFDVELLGLKDLNVGAEEEEPEIIPQINIFEVVVTCRNEGEQQVVYERLVAEGLNCRVLSM